ncbi:hypothetical protein MAPG_08481 [Magnaporthiopsis poae ATCC 64411]|uniref:Uncharacterized protein n=1 Tax=Magnaporthiopsis poae (strain ATCC 64411 / 73-15) TaxID=644358 RepID=A0A0C4E7G8_MAGP6|nr:hypothetical protein MAPG_08481 [Magnaporthiopsis poae ATCC 64411]
MSSNKPRLYIALYPSGVTGNEERQYHWAFLIGPKHEKEKKVEGMRCHVKNRLAIWEYEELQIPNVRSTVSLLARLVIAKITDQQRLLGILRSIPLVQGDPEFRCRTWIARALEAIKVDGKCVGTAVLDWSHIEATAREYVAQKRQGGRYDSGGMALPKPTFDMLEGRETVS